MVKIKFQDSTYLGFNQENKAIKTTREDAWIFTCVTGTKTSLKYVFASRELKGYNTPTFVDMRDNAPLNWQK
jgi:hypothetical protein